MARKLCREPRLSDARLTCKQQQMTTPDTCLIPTARHLRNLRLAPNERGGIGQSIEEWRGRQGRSGHHGGRRTWAAEWFTSRCALERQPDISGARISIGRMLRETFLHDDLDAVGHITG